jgi:uncharacterized protein (TIRG00374 family)
MRALDLGPEARVEEEERAETPGQMAIGARFGDWRAIVSFAFALLILVFAASKVDWRATGRTLATANPGFFALAVVAYYASFPLRTHRWRRLMHNSNHGDLRARIDRYPLWDLTQILYLSWFANVIAPAKLGDVYRAYLARRWIGVSLSRTVGAILAERVLDLVVLFPLLVAAATLTFRAALFSAHADVIRYALLGALLLAVVAVAVPTAMWRAGEGALRVVPRRLHDVYLHFRHGAVASFGDEAPALLGQSVVVWLLEGLRLTFILAALHLVGPGKLGFSAALFLALGASVLTTLPLTPGGLGVVEGFITGTLVVLGIPGGAPVAAAVAVLDRIISYLSIAVLGFLLYAFSNKARGDAPAQSVGTAVATR